MRAAIRFSYVCLIVAGCGLDKGGLGGVDAGGLASSGGGGGDATTVDGSRDVASSGGVIGVATGGASGGGGAVGGATVTGTGGAAATGGATGTGGVGAGGAASGGAGAGGAGMGGMRTGGAGTGGMRTGGAGTGGMRTGGAATGGTNTGGGNTGGSGTGGAATGGAATGGAATGGAATGSSGGGTGGGAYNAVFATSTTYTLAELAATGGGTDAAAVLAGADAACASAATSPGSIAPPGTYVAWMSSAGAHARDRLKAAAGGVAPRGWVRMDGRPFLDQLPPDSAHVAEVRYPIAFNEKGVATYDQVFTGTDPRGLFTPAASCDNWADRTSTTNPPTAGAGIPYAGADSWTAGWGTWCANRLGLYCFQADHVTPLPKPVPPANAKRLFLARYATPAAGLGAADARCAADAAAAGLAGVFRALMAPNAASATSRFHPDGVRPFARMDGVTVAVKDTDLFASQTVLLAPICVTASGAQANGTVFTGAASPLAPGDYTCNDWSTDSGAGVYSRYSNATLGTIRLFLVDFIDVCTRGDSIYCVED